MKEVIFSTILILRLILAHTFGLIKDKVCCPVFEGVYPMPLMTYYIPVA